jgi:transposase InsO family protein
LYAALITDVFSRKIVGAHIGDTLEAEGCLKALEQALAALPANRRPIHHSDRGCQYCCHAYVERLQKSGLAISMTEIMHCYENALAERVNGILKQEYELDRTFRTKAQAKAFLAERAQKAKATAAAPTLPAGPVPQGLPVLALASPQRPGPVKAIAQSPNAPVLAFPGLGQAVLCAMSEGKARGWNALGAQQGVMRHNTQREHHAQAWHAGEFRLQEAIAGADFDRQRQVFRRHAAHRIGDAAAGQLHAILGVLAIGAAGQAIFQQGRVKQLAGIIPGEGPPGPIGATHPGCEAEHQKRCLSRAPTRHGRVMPSGFLRPIGSAIFGKPWAKRAIAPGC